MRRDSRLSGVLHVLLHLAEAARPVPSQSLAAAMQTNPVVIRRILSGLRDRGVVTSEKGHGGGWRIRRDLASVTLREVYDAVGEPMIFAMGNRTETPQCFVEQAVNAALDCAFEEAEVLLLKHFETVTLAEISVDFHARKVSHRGTCAIGAQYAD